MMQSAFSCFARDRTLELTEPRKLQEAVCWLERGSARGRFAFRTAEDTQGVMTSSLIALTGLWGR